MDESRFSELKSAPEIQIAVVDRQRADFLRFIDRKRGTLRFDSDQWIECETRQKHAEERLYAVFGEEFVSEVIAQHIFPGAFQGEKRFAFEIDVEDELLQWYASKQTHEGGSWVDQHVQKRYTRLIWDLYHQLNDQLRLVDDVFKRKHRFHRTSCFLLRKEFFSLMNRFTQPDVNYTHLAQQVSDLYGDLGRFQALIEKHVGQTTWETNIQPVILSFFEHVNAVCSSVRGNTDRLHDLDCRYLRRYIQLIKINIAQLVDYREKLRNNFPEIKPISLHSSIMDISSY